MSTKEETKMIIQEVGKVEELKELYGLVSHKPEIKEFEAKEYRGVTALFSENTVDYSISVFVATLGTEGEQNTEFMKRILKKAVSDSYNFCKAGVFEHKDEGWDYLNFRFYSNDLFSPEIIDLNGELPIPGKSTKTYTYSSSIFIEGQEPKKPRINIQMDVVEDFPLEKLLSEIVIEEAARHLDKRTGKNHVKILREKSIILKEV